MRWPVSCGFFLEDPNQQYVDYEEDPNSDFGDYDSEYDGEDGPNHNSGWLQAKTSLMKKNQITSSGPR